MLAVEEIAIEGNVFVDNEGIWRGIMDHKVGIARIEGSVLEPRGNKETSNSVMEVGKDFRLKEDFRNTFPGVGSTAPFARESKWPLQPEEKAVIPDDASTPDWQQWKL